MRHEEDVVAGAAIRCGDVVLVPLLRVRADGFTAWAGVGTCDVLGFVACGGGGTAPKLLALDDSLADGSAWSAWLAERPALAGAIREAIAGLR